MDMSDWKQAYLDAVQPHVDEPVVGVGVLSRSGGMTRLGVGKISPLASAVMGSKAKKAAGGLPSSVIAAVTPTKVHLFDYSQKRTGAKVKDEVATWDRSAIRITTENKATATMINVELDEGSAIELEAIKGQGFNEDLVRVLMEPTTT